MATLEKPKQKKKQSVPSKSTKTKVNEGLIPEVDDSLENKQEKVEDECSTSYGQKSNLKQLSDSQFSSRLESDPPKETTKSNEDTVKKNLTENTNSKGNSSNYAQQEINSELSENQPLFLPKNEGVISETSDDYANDSYSEAKETNVKINETKICDTKSDLVNISELCPSAPVLEKELSVVQYPILPSYESSKEIKVSKVNNPIKPFMESQLMALYSNQEIAASKHFINSFVDSELHGIHSKKHPLYELIISYLKSKDKFKENQLELNILKTEYKTCQNDLWVLVSAVVTNGAECQDGVNVRVSHEYTIAKFQKPLLESLIRLQNKIKKHANELHALHSYTTTVLKLKIDHYIQNVIMACRNSAGLMKNSPVVLLQESLSPDIQLHIQELRLCISVLFTFQRQIYKDKDFILETREWLTNMISILLRLADWQDHMFLLNQVLRCPAGIGTWACTYIQVPVPPPSTVDSPFADRYLNHTIAVLNVLLCPIVKRDAFLEQFLLSKNEYQDALGENTWVLVDSDGEEDDENPGISSLKENDLVALVNQLPIDELFRSIMLIERKDDKDIYNAEAVTEHHILRLFAFGTVLVRLLHEGILTYNTPRYHQFAKRLCRLIRQTLQYSSDMWEIFRNYNKVNDPAMLLRLQTEFDAFFLRVSVLLYSAQKLGAWQFLAILPFQMVSIQVLWRFFYMLHESDMSDNIFEDITEVVDFREKLSDITVRQNFDERLCIMSAEESYYLLNTFANMIMARDAQDFEFIQFATINLLQIGFFGLGTQENCSKCAAILLSNITNRYPDLLSNILVYVKENIADIGQLSKCLFGELPLNIWRPSEKDIEIISNWLLQNPLASTENYLARLVLLRLNWGLKDDNTMYLPYSLHCRIALLVAEIVEKLAPDVGSTLLDGVRQAIQCTPEQSLLKWSWQMVFRLRLHATDRNNFDVRNIPDVTHYDVIQRGMREQIPLAIYLSIMMTSIGHLVPMICSHGLTQLQVLLSFYKCDAVLIALHNIIPLFDNCKEMLLISPNFQNILVTLLSADRTYVKMAKNLITTEFPGIVLNQFARMIESHIHGPNWLNLISFWVQALVSVPNWSKDPSVLHLLNIILRTGFFNPNSYESITKIFKQLLEKSNCGQSNSTILSWMSLSNNQGVSLLSGGTVSSCPWLAYIVILLEHEYNEIRTGLWKELLNQLYLSTGKTSVDNCLKKAANIVKVSSFTSSSLCIYRWGQQALDTPLTHSILPLLWQRFFMLYLMRVSPVSSGAADRGCVGSKFFDGIVNMNFCKKLKKRLQESVDYFKGKLEAYEELTSEDEINEADQQSKEFYERSLKIFKAYILWLEEPLLQEASLHLSSLPPQYEPHYIAMILQNKTNQWVEFVNFETILAEHKLAMNEWESTCYRNVTVCFRPMQVMGGGELKDPIERIIRRLSSYDKPQQPPAMCVQKAVLPVLNINSRNTITGVLQPHLVKLVQLARLYALQISEHASLDCQYNELVHQLYTMVPSKITKRKTCRSQCAGSATIVLSFRESRLNESIKYQLQANHTSFTTLLIRSLQPPSENLCINCVSIELSINILQSRLEESIRLKDYVTEKQVRDTGVEFFYYLLSNYNEDIKFYPPTQQLFNNCMDKLGQVFIMGVETETLKLCKTIMLNPNRNDLLVPHFTAVNISTAGILQMYENICDKISQVVDVPFALLSKFNINKWLIERKPRLVDRSKFIQLLFKSLTTLGFKPPKETNLLHELLRCHLLFVFRYEFPEHYGEVLMLTLQNSGNQNLAISAFMDLLGALVCPTQIPQDALIRDYLRPIATNQKMLQQRELVDTTALLGKYFTQERLQFGLYGLYPKYRNYIEPLELLFGMTGHSVVVATLNAYCGLLADQMSELLWPYLVDMFSPWIIPYWLQHYKNSTASWIQQLADDRSVLLPWTTVDINYAQRMFNMFVECTQFLIDTLPASTNILSFVWQFYVTNYTHSTIKEHILVVAHTALKNLPWNKFWPSLIDLESMLKVIDQYLPECHTFLGHVFLEVNWMNWLLKLMSAGNIVASIKAHHCLLHLLVKLSIEPNIRQSLKSQGLFDKAKDFSWNILDVGSLEQVFDWYVQSCEPRVILGSEDVKMIDLAVLSLLNVVCCIDTTVQNSDINAMKKRQCYFRAYVKLLTNCSSRHRVLLNSSPKSFQAAITVKLDHIEHIVNNLSKDPFTESDLLLSELICVLNNTTLASVLIETFEKWISARTADSIILQSFLRTVGNSLANSDAAGALLESSLTSYFSISVSQSVEPSWQQVIALLNPGVPKQPPLEQSLVANGRILTLHAILLKQKTKNCDFNNIKVLLEMVLDWLGNIKLTDAIETKVPLLWVQVLSLAYMLSSQDTTKTAGCLKRYASYLLTISESKGLGWGRNLLGAIGIVKQDAVSLHCRFLSKAIAGFVLAQLPDPKGGAQTIRTLPGAPGPVGQPGSNTECAKVLLKLDTRNSEMKSSTELALKEIQDPQNSLHNAVDFAFMLIDILYSKQYLKLA